MTCCFDCGKKHYSKCGFYSPVGDWITDEEIEKMVDNEREKYMDEYMEYVSQYTDDLFFW
jgi:hypothetical protein